MEMWRYSKELKKTANSKLPSVHISNKSAFLYGAQVTTDSNGFRINDTILDTTLFDDQILFLGDSFTLGTGVTVLENIIIGKKSVIGAFSLVNKSIPKNVTAFGVPCRVKEL